jgi:hypothetical protein
MGNSGSRSLDLVICNISGVARMNLVYLRYRGRLDEGAFMRPLDNPDVYLQFLYGGLR